MRLDIRGDIAALPSLIRSRAFLVPVGLLWFGAVWVLGPTNVGVRFVYQYLVVPPAVFPIVLAAVLAPRAGYLLGLLVGLVEVVVVLVFVYALLPMSGVTSPPHDLVFWGGVVWADAIAAILYGGIAGGMRHLIVARLHEDDGHERQGAEPEVEAERVTR